MRFYIWGHPTHPTYLFFANSLCRFSQASVRWLALVFGVLPAFLVMFSGLPYLCLKGSEHFGSDAFVSYGDSTFWPFLCLSAYGLSRPSGLRLLLLFSVSGWPLSVLGL